MNENDLFFWFAVLVVGLLAFGVTFLVISQLRKNNNKGPLGAASPQKNTPTAGLPQDEHKGAQAIIGQLRRYASLHDYQVVEPVSLANSKDAADLDALLVGWFGVLGVKCLGYGGVVYGSAGEETWVQTLNGARRSFENPLTRAQKSARVVRDALFQAHLKNVPVETLVIFTGKKTQLNLPRSTPYYTEKTFSAYLKSTHFEEDKKVEVAPVVAALQQN